MDSELVIAVPVLGRPHHIPPLLRSIRETAPKALVVFATSGFDETGGRAVADAVRRDPLCDVISVQYLWSGDYARKVNSVARTHRGRGLLFTGATDLKFHPGWLEAAAAKMTGPVGVVGTNDLGSPRVMSGEHATHMLFAQWYISEFGTIDEPGKVFHEGYPHEFVDDEAVETAKQRGAWRAAPSSWVEHLHPDWGKAPSDAMYRSAPYRARVGYRLYQDRRHLWNAG